MTLRDQLLTRLAEKSMTPAEHESREPYRAARNYSQWSSRLTQGYGKSRIDCLTISGDRLCGGNSENPLRRQFFQKSSGPCQVRSMKTLREPAVCRPHYARGFGFAARILQQMTKVNRGTQLPAFRGLVLGRTDRRSQARLPFFPKRLGMRILR